MLEPEFLICIRSVRYPVAACSSLLGFQGRLEHTWGIFVRYWLAMELVATPQMHDQPLPQKFPSAVFASGQTLLIINHLSLLIDARNGSHFGAAPQDGTAAIGNSLEIVLWWLRYPPPLVGREQALLDLKSIDALFNMYFDTR